MNKILLSILPMLVDALSPALRAMLGGFAIEFHKKAKSTSNPFDDMGAALILAVLGMETPED